MAVRQRPARGAPGQHFLRSSRLAAELVRNACVEAGDLVVEIGAGAGTLTHALAQTEARILAIELDSGLAAQLRRRFAERPNVTVVETDALAWTWPLEPFAVVANLPFAGSTALLEHLLGDPALPLQRADVIVQWEVAAKHAAVWPATLKGTCWKAWYELVITARLARSAFSPAPAVDAAVLRATRRRQPLVPPEDHERYRTFVASAFRFQGPVRRVLRPHLSPLEVKRLAPVLGFSPDARPHDLDATQWARLFAFSRARRVA